MGRQLTKKWGSKMFGNLPEVTQLGTTLEPSQEVLLLSMEHPLWSSLPEQPSLGLCVELFQV